MRLGHEAAGCGAPGSPGISAGPLVGGARLCSGWWWGLEVLYLVSACWWAGPVPHGWLQGLGVSKSW